MGEFGEGRRQVRELVFRQRSDLVVDLEESDDVGVVDHLHDLDLPLDVVHVLDLQYDGKKKCTSKLVKVVYRYRACPPPAVARSTLVNS